MAAAAAHVPVLLEAVIKYLAPVPGGIYVDGTLGGGGHAAAILAAAGPSARLIGIDRDPAALALAGARLQAHGNVTLCRGNFRHLEQVLDEHDIGAATGILLDLGVSSLHFDQPERGFSYQFDGPLDMRMDPDHDLTAADIVNEWSVGQLTQIFRELGEERWASRIAKFIADTRTRRPLTRTDELVAVIKAAIPAGARRRGPHPARRTFQALRMAVNDELGALAAGITAAVRRLQPGGRLVIISFHSLEDRLVKHEFRRLSTDCSCGPGAPCTCDRRRLLKVLTPRPVGPDEAERTKNPRARSAKLRAAQRVLGEKGRE